MHKLKRCHVDEVINAFKELGFVNVTKEPLNDLITGLFNRNDSVESITPKNGETIKALDDIEFDEQIVISYHSFKHKT